MMDFDLERQQRFLHTMADQWKDIYDAFPRNAEDRPGGDGFYLNQDMLGAVDAELLYSVVRTVRPRRVIEIGGGWSTLLIQTAMADAKGKHIVVQEDASEGLRQLQGIKLMDVPIFGVGGRIFSELEDGDILSIDGSHVYAEKSDVQLYLQYFLPSLKPGVLVHIHDIFLPDAYPKNFQMRGYDEQDHLAVFLNANPEWKIQFAGHWFSKQAPDELKATFASHTDDNISGSFWITKEMTKREAEIVLKRKPTKRAPKKKTVTRSFTADTVVETPHEFRVNRGGVNCIDCGKPEDEGLHA
jgi:predicted O-methyltransferase YrrM